MSRLKGLSETFKYVLTELRAFLHRQRWKEALIFFCFVLLSFGFWVLQSLQEEYETEVTVPIRYVNVPAYIAFDSELPKSINIHIRDKGSALLNYSIGKQLHSINIDLGKLSTDETQYSVSHQFLQSEIQKQLLATTKLYSFLPQHLVLSYGLRKSKDVPVIFDGDIQTQNGFLVSDKIVISPDIVTIYGNKNALDTIENIKTSFVKIEGIKKTIKRDVPLKSVSGIKLHTESVSIIIPVEEYTEKTLEIPVRIVDVPSIYTIRTFPQTVSVSCNIPVSKFKELTNDSLSVDLSFKLLEENVSGTLDVDLTSKPLWIKNYYIAPNKIEFLLEVNNNE